MEAIVEFDAEILEGRGGGAWVAVPVDLLERFGTRGRVKVKASFDGVPYRGSVVPMGGLHVLGVQKAIRATIGKWVGDTVHVILEQDTAPREVALPQDLSEALAADPAAGAFFAGLSYTDRRETVEWIAGAKRAETRAQRVQAAVEMLRRGEKARS